jgi:hypothetical protein
MKFFLLFTLLLFSIEITYSQDIEREIEQKIDSLRLQGVDTIIFYSFTCNGMWVSLPIEDCTDDGNYHYLFWEHFENIYVQRFERCHSFNTLKLAKLFSLNSLREHFKTIEKEEIRNPVYKIYNKKTKETSHIIYTVSHSCYHELQIFFNDNKLDKTIDTYGLEDKFMDDGKQNQSYIKNHKTILYQFLKILEIETNLLDNFFVKTKRKM